MGMSNVAMPPSTGSSGIWDWTPDAATVLADLTNSVAIDDPRVLMKSFQGIDIGAEAYPWFEGFGWVRFTSEHWEVPLTAVIQKGMYFTVCAPPQWYGNNLSGFFVMLFIYSKVAELLDTVLLLLAK